MFHFLKGCKSSLLLDFSLKFTKIPFSSLALPTTAGGAKALARPLATIREPRPTSKGNEKEGERRGREGKGEREMGKEMEGLTDKWAIKVAGAQLQGRRVKKTCGAPAPSLPTCYQLCLSGKTMGRVGGVQTLPHSLSSKATSWSLIIQLKMLFPVAQVTMFWLKLQQQKTMHIHKLHKHNCPCTHTSKLRCCKQ